MSTGARSRLALALDLADLDAATALARRLAPWFSVAKVGLELWSAAGPETVGRLRAEGFAVFCDVKLHDIPTTVGRAARVLGRLGASYVTLHTSGGDAMLRAGVDGLRAGARDAGLESPVALGVTVLTSESDTGAFEARLDAAARGGCGGVVCAAGEVATVKARRPGLLAVVPGIRRPGDAPGDQARVATPRAAIAAGADLLVIGRAVTSAADPEAAAEAIAAEVATATPAR